MKASKLELRFLELCRECGLPEPTPEYVFAAPRRFRFDWAWPGALKVAAECEGGSFSNGRHVRGKGFEQDCYKYNLAAFHGWTVFRYTAKMLDAGPPALALLEMTLKTRSNNELARVLLEAEIERERSKP